MENQKYKENFCFDKSSRNQSQVEGSLNVKKKPTFYELFAEVKKKIEFDCFDKKILNEVEDICLIIAEVLKLPSDTMVRVAGNNLPAEMVQDIYSRLEHENVQLVIENYARATYEIKHKKTYIRTALYNSVFEINVHYTNAVNKDNPQWVKAPFGMRRGEK